MKEGYNSIDYWAAAVDANKTIRGHIFMDELPTEKSIYMHSLNFSNNNGIENVYSYFPNVRALLGYIEYSYLQEVFYKWIYGTSKVITEIPFITVNEVIREGLRNNKLNKNDAEKMKNQYEFIKTLWNKKDSDILRSLMKFCREFNKTWLGDEREFLYVKFYKTPNDLCDYVLDSAIMTGKVDEYKEKTGIDIDEWKDICKNAIIDKNKARKFRNLLMKKLTETL